MIFDKISLVTGGFDPIHSGHLRYFERAKDFSDYLIVGLNGDPVSYTHLRAHET